MPALGRESASASCCRPVCLPSDWQPSGNDIGTGANEGWVFVEVDTRSDDPAPIVVEGLLCLGVRHRRGRRRRRRRLRRRQGDPAGMDGVRPALAVAYRPGHTPACGRI